MPDRPPLESFLSESGRAPQRPPLSAFMTSAPTTSGKIPQQEQMGAGERFITGLQDPLIGGKQLYTNLTGSPEEAQKVNTQVQAREADIQRRGGSGVVRGLGEATTGLPLMAAGPLGAIAGGAVGGAMSGALQPVTSRDYWSQKTDDVLLGTAFGAGGGGAVKTLGTILSPTLAPEAKALIKSGVQLTPGQMMGGLGRRVEDAFKSLPILGSFIRGAEGRGIEGFNRGVLNQVLEPIGQKLDPGTVAGQAAIKETYQKLGDAYGQVLPKIQLRLDHDLAQDIHDIRFSATELPEAQRKQFDTILQNRLQPYFGGPGLQTPGPAPLASASGQNLKNTIGTLRSLSETYRASGDPAQRLLAARLDDVQQAMRRGMIRQNPAEADTLNKIDSGYAMFARARNASIRRANSEGVFTPSDLLQTIKTQDKTRGKRAFAHGDALLQLYATYGQKVLPGKIPDTGTVERALYDGAIMAGGLGAETGHVSPLLPIGLAGGALPYTRPGMTALNALAQPGPLRGALGAGVRKAAPYVGIGATPSLQQQNDKPTYGGPQE
jgi:hypothetical protein